MVLTTHTAQGGEPSWSPGAKRIAFTAYDSSGSVVGVWTVDVDGTRARKIVGVRAERDGSLDPSWAPSRQQIAYVVKGRLWVVRSDGSSLRAVGRNTVEVLPEIAWSPDGQHIAAADCRQGSLGCGVTVFDLNAATARRIGRKPTSQEREDEIDVAATPAWSPNGTQIAYARGYLPSTVVVAPVIGDGERALAHGNQPTWSPDGSQIAFTSDNGVGVVSARGGQPQIVANPPGEERAPTWSRDGHQLAFWSSRTPYVVEIKTGYLHRLTPGGVSRSALRSVNGWASGGRAFVVAEHFDPPDDPLGREETTQLVALRLFRVGHGWTQLLGPARDSQPVWAPDGRRIAFVREQDATRMIIVKIITGRKEHILTAGTEPLWSPNGRMIAFRRGFSTFVINALGGTAHRLARATDPTWSPNSAAIAFSSQNGAVWSIRLADRARRQITRSLPADENSGDPRSAQHPQWSPDGRRLLFTTMSSDDDGYHSDTGAFVVNPDGTDLQPLARLTMDWMTPAWSPDGKHIAWRNTEGPSDGPFAVTDATGSSEVAIDGSQPSWSADGTQLVFVAPRSPCPYGDCYDGLRVVGADGTNKRRLTSDPGDREPHWQPQPPAKPISRVTSSATR